MKNKKGFFKRLAATGICSVLATVLLTTGVWIASHGVPLTGMPKSEDVRRVTLRSGTTVREIEKPEDVELLVRVANLLNYRLFGEEADQPEIEVTYHLIDGGQVSLQAGRKAMWRQGKQYVLKEKDVFVNIVKGLFFEGENG